MNKIIKKQKNSYAQGKQLAILLTEYFTNNSNSDNSNNSNSNNSNSNNSNSDNKLNEFFKNHKKRDDLADSMLMTLHYMERDNISKIIKAKKKASDL